MVVREKKKKKKRNVASGMFGFGILAEFL